MSVRRAAWTAYRTDAKHRQRAIDEDNEGLGNESVENVIELSDASDEEEEEEEDDKGAQQEEKGAVEQVPVNETLVRSEHLSCWEVREPASICASTNKSLLRFALYSRFCLAGSQ